MQDRLLSWENPLLVYASLQVFLFQWFGAARFLGGFRLQLQTAAAPVIHKVKCKIFKNTILKVITENIVVPSSCIVQTSRIRF